MNFKIHSPPHTKFAAIHLSKQLCKLGHTATVVNDIDFKDNTIYIIYNAGSFNRMPQNYIVYQTEVAVSSWFNARYYGYLANALAVWEYDESNVIKYRQYAKNIAIVSPGVMPQKQTVKDIPLLFYGHFRKDGVIKCPRRYEVIKRLGNRLMVIENKLEFDMWQLLARAKVVLNIHYYEKAPLETFRINEALSFNCHVISERSISGDNKYINHASFFDTTIQMNEHIERLTIEPFNMDLAPLDNTHQIQHALKILGLPKK